MSVTSSGHRATMPSQVRGRLSLFDRFADLVGGITSRAAFFSFCVALVVLWGPSYLIFRSADTWQLVINTVTTIVTFLLVALLQNTQKRSDDAVQQKLNAIAKGLADTMYRVSVGEQQDLARDRKELLRAVGLEDRESS
ncbi:MAG: low affinity iron permease family protein [Kutzneria sp.]|nr:low affinity iron permease family protein [Kutzneria sp.]